VPLNTKLSAVFDMQMAPLDETGFILMQGQTPVAGAVATSADGLSATFTPAGNLPASTALTATITTQATSADGESLAADRSWTFTTGTTADEAAPVVNSTSPADGATGAPINTRIAATFSEPLDPQSIGASTFTVTRGGAAVSGSVVYGPGASATFTAADPLATNTLFTATITTGVTDLAGNPLAAELSWTFTTGTTTAQGPAPVLLGAAGNYAILAKAAISSVPASAVTGDVALSPAAASFITGFSLVADPTNVFATSTQVVGQIFAADYAVPTPSNLTTAVGNMQSAYTDAAGRPTPDFLELGTGNIGGMTLEAGLYKWTSTITIPADVTLSGGENDVWIFQTTGDLTMSAAKNVILSGGAQAKNVFWQVAGQASFGAGAHFEGIILCETEVTLQTGASMNGRILAQTQVALDQATVTQPSE
jgi:hypothetical protein